jgi:hypothetical protein
MMREFKKTRRSFTVFTILAIFFSSFLIASQFHTGIIPQQQDVTPVSLFIASNPQYSWNVTWGGSQNEHGDGVVVAPDGSIYCVGLTLSDGAGDDDLALVKFFPNGTREWNVTWGGWDEEEGKGITLDTTGAIYCTGFTRTFGAGSADIALVKFFPNGTRA